jgi:hypothetical protein
VWTPSLPLATLLDVCVAAPLRAQCLRTNRAAAAMLARVVAPHVQALRKFLLLECGEFAQTLADAAPGLAQRGPGDLLRSALAAAGQVTFVSSLLAVFSPP